MKKKGTNNHQLTTGLVLLCIIPAVIGCLVLWNGFSVETNMNTRLLPPSSNYLLGTDDMGRDLLSCILYGLWISLGISLGTVVISAVTGSLVGMMAGMAGGIADTVIMRMVDIILSFPGILLAISLASFFRQSILSLMAILTICGWVEYARIVRGETLKYKQQEFVRAATAYNASYRRIIFHHLLPAILPLILVQASLGIPGVILAESGLDFLGIGIGKQYPTLGQLIGGGRGHLFDIPRLIVFPGIFLFAVVLTFNLIGEGLRKKLTGTSSKKT